MTDRIIIAADELDEQATLALTSAIGDQVYAVKIHEMYDRLGPSIVGALKDAGAQRVWMDAKLYDIPNTTRARAKAFADNGIDIITAHASGGVEMLKAAKEGAGNTEVYAITILTSLASETVEDIYGRPVAEEVLALARIAAEAGVDGIVCSAQEAAMLSAEESLKGMKIVTPGIRSTDASRHDQVRVATPKEAIEAGATHLVIGRQITKADNPVAALRAIAAELSS